MSKQMIETLITAAEICGYEVIRSPAEEHWHLGDTPHIMVKAKNATIEFPFMPQLRLHQAMTVARHMNLKIITHNGDMQIITPDNRTVVHQFTEFNYTNQLCSGIMTLVYWSQKNAKRNPTDQPANPR